MKFKPEDFLGVHSEKHPPTELQVATAVGHAGIANAKLQEWLGDAPVVYLLKPSSGVTLDNDGFVDIDWDLVGRKDVKAKLVCIEEL